MLDFTDTDLYFHHAHDADDTQIHEHDTEHEHEHAYGHNHEHNHSEHRHVHSEEEKKAVLNRLSRAIGHLNKVKRMVENDDDCSDVLVQLAAVKSALTNTGKVILTNHINHCILEAVHEDDLETIEKMTDAINMFIK